MQNEKLFRKKDKKNSRYKKYRIGGADDRQITNGNEPSHHVAFLFFLLGRKDLGRMYVR